jgi:hypothetical protein
LPEGRFIPPIRRQPWPRSKPDPASIAVGALLTAMIAMGQISTAIYAPSMPSLVAASAPRRNWSV